MYRQRKPKPRPRTKVSKQGNVIEVTHLTGCNRECRVKKLDGERYVNLGTGEIGYYEKREGQKRTDNVQELRKSFAKMRALINANCTDAKKLRWVTLTYSENMQDLERLYKDFKSFMKRVRRRWGACEYIAVPEPQRRGAWHMHLILIYPVRAPYMPNAELREVWGHGFVRVQSLVDVDNVGAYLSAYLGDLEAEDGEGCDEVKSTKDGKSKRIIKGGRLGLYPAGMNVYRCSRGVKRPEEYWVETKEQRDELMEIDLTYKPYVRTYTAELENGMKVEIEKRYYNVKRPRDWKRFHSEQRTMENQA